MARKTPASNAPVLGEQTTRVFVYHLADSRLLAIAVRLAAVIDWFSRKVLAWRLSITMDVGFCIEAVEEAMVRYGRPEIFNSDQGSQFIRRAFTMMLIGNGIAISMGGRGAWRDNVFIERLWRSLKHEEVYLRAYASVSEARASIALSGLL